MNKILIRLSTVILSLGMLGAAACSGCSQTSDTSSSSAVMQQQSMNCGAYTHREGNQCVGNTTTTKNTSTKGSPTTLSTSGNN